jgi:adenylate kinase
VPDDLTIKLWREHVAALIDRGGYDPDRDLLILDGMPRSLTQARMLDDLIEPLIIIHLIASDLDAMVRRMRLRARKQGRHDDVDENVIRRRFEVYAAATAPVLDHYDADLLTTIDGMGTIDEVSARVWEAIRPVVETI